MSRRSAAHPAQDSRCPIKDIFRLHRHDIDAAMLSCTFAKAEHAQFSFDTVDCLSDDFLGVPQSNLPVVLTVHDQERASNAIEYTFEGAELQGRDRCLDRRGAGDAHGVEAALGQTIRDPGSGCAAENSLPVLIELVKTPEASRAFEAL